MRKWVAIGVIVLQIFLLGACTNTKKPDYSGQGIDWGDHYYWNSSTGTVEWTPWK